MFVGVALSVSTWATPVPLRATVVGEFVAVLTSDTLPLTLPAAAGANRAVNVVLCPAVSVCGNVSPVMLRPAPVTLEELIVTFELPVFVMVTVWLAVLPTNTLPKLMLVGEALSVSTCVTPVPLNETTVGEFVAVLASDTLPLTAPAAAGANRAVNVVLCPAVSVSGSVSPVTLNPAPVTVDVLMVTLTFPVFVTVTV